MTVLARELVPRGRTAAWARSPGVRPWA